MNPVATTDRIELRRLELSDADSLKRLNDDPEVLRFTGDKPFESIADAELLLTELRTRYETDGFGRWAIMRRTDDRFLGWCGLRRLPREGVDLGFRLHRDCWGQGYATEAARASVDLGFGMYGLPFLLGRAVRENAASITILEKLGFEPWLKTSGHGFDDVRYSILRRADSPVANPAQGVVLAHTELSARLLQPADQMDFFMLEGNPNVLRYADGNLASYENVADQIGVLRASAPDPAAELRVFAVSSSRRNFGNSRGGLRGATFRVRSPWSRNPKRSRSDTGSWKVAGARASAIRWQGWRWGLRGRNTPTGSSWRAATSGTRRRSGCWPGSTDIVSKTGRATRIMSGLPDAGARQPCGRTCNRGSARERYGSPNGSRTRLFTLKG